MRINQLKLPFCLKILLLGLTVTSFLVIPKVQGTLISLIALPCYLYTVSFTQKDKLKKYLKQIFYFIFLYCIFQLVIILSTINANKPDWISNSGLVLVNQSESNVAFKTSVITQSIYLISGISIFFLVRNFVNEEWIRVAVNGATFVSLLGLGELIFNFFTHKHVQFFNNRFFEDSGKYTMAGRTQFFDLGNVVIQRLDGISIEPSMYALSVVPFLYLAHSKKMKFQTLILLVSLILSFSTTAYLGLVGFLFLYWKSGNSKLMYSKLLAPLLACTCILIGWQLINLIYENLFIYKIKAVNLSGVERTSNALNTFHFFTSDMNIFEKLFGIGFGTVRSTDMTTTLLVNTGVIGFIIFLRIFLQPLTSKKFILDLHLKVCLVFVLTSMLVAVPEFSFLTVWFILGYAYSDHMKRLQIDNL